jgi:glycoside/pentoside/hexuronide:cation symporter, GPH family
MENKPPRNSHHFSAMMVGLKAGLSIGGALVTWILGQYGYINKDNIAVIQEIIQPESVALGARMLVSVYASIPFFLVVALLFLYEINKKKKFRLKKN